VRIGVADETQAVEEGRAHGGVRLLEQRRPLRRERQRQPAPVVGIRLTRDQSPRDEPVDHRRDRRRLDRESRRQRGRHGGAVDEQRQQPVLGKRQLQRRDGHLDQLGETGDGAARDQAEVLGVDVRGNGAPSHHRR
jgi:hypothetical protein